jgi:hypothetical protein
MSTITIKFVYLSETRRATYNLPITLQQIQNDIIKTITGTSDFEIKCYHDYREVLVTTDSEFQHIVKYHSEKTLPLRIRISQEKEKDQVPEIITSTQSKSCSPSCSPISSPQVKRRVESPVQSSHNVNCSLCTCKIYGIRWKCTVCPHCDLCNNCEQYHPRSHPLIRIVEELPLRSEVVFSVCTGLNHINKKIDELSESPPITTATSTAKTAREEIADFITDITAQAMNNTAALGHELEGLVQDATRVVQSIPTKIKGLQTKLSEMLICNPATPSSPIIPTPSVPQENRSPSAPSAPQENRSPSPSTTEKPEVFSEQLELLKNMGFNQPETNLQLLLKHNGNIELCVNELLD